MQESVDHPPPSSNHQSQQMKGESHTFINNLVQHLWVELSDIPSDDIKTTDSD